MLHHPHQVKFLVSVNLLGNKLDSASASGSGSDLLLSFSTFGVSSLSLFAELLHTFSSMLNEFVCEHVSVCSLYTLILSGLFQVLLGEVNLGLTTTQVVVKELKASASVQDQMLFLDEAQPYRYTFLIHHWSCFYCTGFLDLGDFLLLLYFLLELNCLSHRFRLNI